MDNGGRRLNLILCDQFIYTTATIKNKSGYQIVAKSKNITNEFIKQLEGCYYPAGIDPSSFNESKSLLILDDKIVHSVIKNIGIGYDKREDTLHNHSIVTSINDFKNLSNDTRIFQKYYQKANTIGELNQIIIEDNNLQPSIKELNKIPRYILETIIDSILSHKKIVIIGIDDSNLIPNILSILPPSLRFKSYSSYVKEFENKYDIIQSKLIDINKINARYKKINIKDLLPFYTNDNDLLLEKSIKFLADIANDGKIDSLKAIHKTYENLIHEEIRDKIILSIYVEQLESISDQLLKKILIIDIMTILVKFTDDVIEKYSSKIKKHMSTDEFKRYEERLKIMEQINKFKDKSINHNTIKELFHDTMLETTKYRYDVLRELFKKHQREFIKNGSKILIESQFEGYTKELISFFINEEKLHQCIYQLFENNNELSVTYQQGILESLIKPILDSKPEIFFKMYKHSIYDIANNMDVEQFKKILEKISDKTIMPVDTNMFLNFIKNTFVEITKIKERSDKSYITGAGYNMIQFVEIMKILSKLCTRLEEISQKDTPNQKISNQRKKIKEFIKLYEKDNKTTIRPEYPF